MRNVHADVAGVDGCRAGWVVATVTAEGVPRVGVRVLARLDDLARAVRSGALGAVAVDIPIGLSAHGWRPCDAAARRALGPRRHSIFPAPARRVLGADTYEAACASSLEACGKKVSRQVFGILPRIAEVDALQSPALQRRFFEMCPELSFSVLVGAPMRAYKKTAAGRAERLAALRPAFGDLSGLVSSPPPGAAPDDVLDALVGAWTARRQATGSHVRLGGELDERGLRMEMTA